MIRLNVDGVTATVTEKEILTAGRVGLECAFTFTGEWDGLFKTAVFQGVESVDVALPDNTCIVPWEAMQVEGVQLKIGVFGANGANGEGAIVIPTVWANAGKIQPSAVGSGTEPTEPSQNANAYAVETAEEALSIARGVQEAAANGDFDGEPGADGADGADGISPSATVRKVGRAAIISITDKDGTTSATVNDGTDGSLFWQASQEPIKNAETGLYLTPVSNLTGQSGTTPKAGDVVFYSYFYYEIMSVIGGTATLSEPTSIRGGPLGRLWTTQDVYLLRQVLSHLKYDSDSAGVIAGALLASLEATPENTGWSAAQIDLLDNLLDHVKYTDGDGGEYADALIDSLKGQLVQLGGSVTLSENGTHNVSSYMFAVVDTPTYTDGDGVKY